MSKNRLTASAAVVMLVAATLTLAAKTSAAQATPDPERVYRVGNGITAPRLIKSVQPEYTGEARQRNIQGTVVMKVIVGTDGLAHSILVDEGLGYGLDEKAIECIKQWTFQPGEKDGMPVRVGATIEMNFRLPESARL